MGRNLARYTGARFIDLDEYLEKKLDCPVGSFFAEAGEAAFRKEELKALQELLIPAYREDSPDAPEQGFTTLEPTPSPTLILSLGGGTVTTPACATLIRQYTRCIYLHCPKELLLKRLIKNNEKRPLLAGKNPYELDLHITALMEKREPLYRACAHAEFEIHPNEALPAAVERICPLL